MLQFASVFMLLIDVYLLFLAWFISVGLPISARVETTKLECPIDRLFLINLAVAYMLLDTVQAYLDSQPFGTLSLLYSTPANKTTHVC